MTFFSRVLAHCCQKCGVVLDDEPDMRAHVTSEHMLAFDGVTYTLNLGFMQPTDPKALYAPVYPYSCLVCKAYTRYEEASMLAHVVNEHADFVGGGAMRVRMPEGGELHADESHSNGVGWPAWEMAERMHSERGRKRIV